MPDWREQHRETPLKELERDIQDSHLHMMIRLLKDHMMIPPPTGLITLATLPQGYTTGATPTMKLKAGTLQEALIPLEVP